jgi:hypothetical protein
MSIWRPDGGAQGKTEERYQTKSCRTKTPSALTGKHSNQISQTLSCKLLSHFYKNDYSSPAFVGSVPNGPSLFGHDRRSGAAGNFNVGREG